MTKPLMKIMRIINLLAVRKNTLIMEQSIHVE